MSKNFILNIMSILISTLIMCYIIPDLIFVILFSVISLSYLIFIYFIDKKYTYKISRFSECCNFIEILSHSLFCAHHDALLSDCRLICGDSIISHFSPFVWTSLRTIRKILSSIVSVPLSLNTTLTL